MYISKYNTNDSVQNSFFRTKTRDFTNNVSNRASSSSIKKAVHKVSVTHLWWRPRSLQLSVSIMVTCTSEAWSAQSNTTTKSQANKNNSQILLITTIKMLGEPSNIWRAPNTRIFRQIQCQIKRIVSLLTFIIIYKLSYGFGRAGIWHIDYLFDAFMVLCHHFSSLTAPVLIHIHYNEKCGQDILRFPFCVQQNKVKKIKNVVRVSTWQKFWGYKET